MVRSTLSRRLQTKPGQTQARAGSNGAGRVCTHLLRGAIPVVEYDGFDDWEARSESLDEGDKSRMAVREPCPSAAR